MACKLEHKSLEDRWDRHVWNDEWSAYKGKSLRNHNPYKHMKCKNALFYESKTFYLLQSPGKIVLLMHDVAYRDGGNINSENSAEDELITFLSLAKESGYIFSTLDRYLQD